MSISKPIQYLFLIALIFTMPVYPNSFFGYCSDLFQSTKQSVRDVINGQATTETKIGVGLAVFVITSLLTYALIKYVIYKRDAAFLKERGIGVIWHKFLKFNGNFYHPGFTPLNCTGYFLWVAICGRKDL